MREIRDRVVDVQGASRLKYMLDAHCYMPLLVSDAARIDAFCAQQSAGEHHVGNVLKMCRGLRRWLGWKPAVDGEIHVRYLPWGFKLVGKAARCGPDKQVRRGSGL